MLGEFHYIKKCCIECGIRLILKNSRDIYRKKYCDRVCGGKHRWQIGILKGIKKSNDTRILMRNSKIKLLQYGWKPVGWKKYGTSVRISSRGYLFKGNKRVHALVIEKKLGRPLVKGEVVHHVNFDKFDNRPENLYIMSRSGHMKLHLALRNDNYATAKI